MTRAQQWRDTGSCGGHMQAVITTAEARVDETYRAFIIHAGGCASCRIDGQDCVTAAELRDDWRAAKGLAS